MTTQTEGVKAGHTKGPWKICGREPDAWKYGNIISTETYDTVASCDIKGSSVTDEGQRKANCRLIAAAPDLLEALTEMVRQEDEYGEGTVHPTVLNDARSAIAKALGQ